MNISFKNTRSNYIIHNNQIFRYIENKKIFKKYSRMDLLNIGVLKNAMQSGFSLEKISTYDKKDNRMIYSYQQIDMEYIKKSKEDYLYLEKELTNLSDIGCFYQLYIYIYIKGIRIDEFSHSGEYPGCLMLFVDPNEKYNFLFGKKKLSRYFDSYYYVQPTSAIDKIVGVKKHHDISKFGTEQESNFTGEEKEYVLDMHNFDESIYAFFREHNALEIEW